VTEDEKMEFWNSLARLYDDCLALKEATAELCKSISGFAARESTTSKIFRSRFHTTS
jgi:hypothetical protein